MEKPERPDAGWIAESLGITLRTALRLITWPPRRATVPADELPVRLVDLFVTLIDHAQIWSSLYGHTARSSREPASDELEIASYVARIAAGLEARMLSVPGRAGAEVRRAAIACLPDLQAQRRWADAALRWGEARGAAPSLRELRAELPSRREFASTCH